jgi:hypothetical protein
MTSLTITNPAIIDFFNKNPMYDPERFFLQLISTYENNKLKPMVVKPEKTDNMDVSKDELLQFYEEYQFFIKQKNNIINLSREYNKDLQRNFTRVKFQKLDEYFSKHLNVKSQTYVCRVCNIFNVSTKKGLITHERNCRAKNITINTDDEGSHAEDDMDNHSECVESDDGASVDIEPVAVVLPTPPPPQSKPVIVFKKGK